MTLNYLSKPSCFGDPNTFDSNTERCRVCAFRITCEGRVREAISDYQTDYNHNRGGYYSNYYNSQTKTTTSVTPSNRSRALIDPAVFVLDSDVSLGRQFATHLALDVAQQVSMRTIDLINIVRADYIAQLTRNITNEEE